MAEPHRSGPPPCGAAREHTAPGRSPASCRRSAPRSPCSPGIAPAGAPPGARPVARHRTRRSGHRSPAACRPADSGRTVPSRPWRRADRLDGNRPHDPPVAGHVPADASRSCETPGDPVLLDALQLVCRSGCGRDRGDGGRANTQRRGSDDSGFASHDDLLDNCCTSWRCSDAAARSTQIRSAWYYRASSESSTMLQRSNPGTLITVESFSSRTCTRSGSLRGV